MGEYKRIQGLIERSVPEYAALRIVPRGTPIFPDPLMTGELRFARRLGANFAAMTPDNLLRLTEAAPAAQSVISIERTLLWFEQNALLSFNGIEMFEIADWSDATNQVVLRQPLTAGHDSQETATLWATPLVMHEDAVAGVSAITVRSRYNLLNGDTVTFPINEALSSLTEFNVLVAQNGGASGDAEFPFLFTLLLHRPIPVDLIENQSRIYLRAFPGYISPVLRVPKIQAPSQLGPFVVDYLGTPLNSRVSVPETFSLRTFDTSGGVVFGTGPALVTVEKNHPVMERPIWAENMLFWTVERGSGGYTMPNQFRLLSDAEGKARIQTSCVPQCPAGTSWQFRVRATADGLLRIGSYPNAFQDFALVANQTQTCTVTIPAPADKLEILIRLNAKGEMTLRDAIPTGANVASFQYGLVVRVVGDSNYQSTSVIVKPLFLSLADLTARYDANQTYDSGLIYL